MRKVFVLALLLVLAGVPSALAANDRSGSPFELTTKALLGGETTDLFLDVTSNGEPIPERLEKVQIKAYRGDDHVVTQNLFDIPIAGGRAVIQRTGLERGDSISVAAHLKEGAQQNLSATTQVRLRPDLSVSSIDAPARVVRRQAFSLTATIAELGGDTAATGVVRVFDGISLLGSRAVSVRAGGISAADFTLRIPASAFGVHSLRVEVGSVDPAEFVTANNADTAEILVRMYAGDGVVATEEWHATNIGAQILREGGNAFDAAAAVQFALNVTLPHTNGIGGGATILVHRASDGAEFAIDAREKAPAAATRDMFIGTTALRSQSGCTVGVPGTLRAVEQLQRLGGSMSLAETLAPATALAEDGFAVGPYLALATTADQAAFQPETRAIFRQPDGSPLPAGYWLRQPDLARTFRIIASQGVDAFYSGDIAAAIVAAQTRTRSARCQGRMTAADLAGYRVRTTEPLAAGYRGYTVETAPPSTSGGLVLLEALKLAHRFPLGNSAEGFGFGSVKAMHLEIEALRLALADRLLWMGDDDPEFGSPICVGGMLSDGYTAARSALISEATRIATVVPGAPCAFEPVDEPVAAAEPDEAHTTHFSILDKWGNVVSFTSTLTDTFGTGITVPGYGFALNDSLANFNLPAASDRLGPNDPAGGRRPMGSTAPTMILKDGEPLVATGAPGSGWIPSMVFQVVSNVVDYGMPIQDAVDAPRFWFNSTQINTAAAWNPGFSPDVIAELRARGHKFGPTPAPGRDFGSAQSLQVDPVTFELSGASDRRSSGGSAVVLP